MSVPEQLHARKICVKNSLRPSGGQKATKVPAGSSKSRAVTTRRKRQVTIIGEPVKEKVQGTIEKVNQATEGRKGDRAPVNTGSDDGRGPSCVKQ